MSNRWFIALGAGLVAAVVFVSASTGPMLMRTLLFALTPLSIALAGFGWGWMTAAIAGILGSVLIAALTGQPLLAIVFVLTQALPMAALIYLANLSRPLTAEQGAGPSTPATAPQSALEWYPVGRLVVWACGLAAAIAVGVIMMLGITEPDFVADLEKKLAETLKANLAQMSDSVELDDEHIATITKLAIAVMPGGGAIAIACSLLFSLWISARVTMASGQMARPWPDLAAIDFPTGTALCLALAIAASFLPPPVSVAATAVTGALLLAYLLLGLAVVHYTTRGNPWRPFALWALYVGILFIQGVATIIVLLGLSESFLRLRTKFGGPPDIQPTPTE